MSSINWVATVNGRPRYTVYISRSQRAGCAGKPRLAPRVSVCKMYIHLWVGDLYVGGRACPTLGPGGAVLVIRGSHPRSCSMHVCIHLCMHVCMYSCVRVSNQNQIFVYCVTVKEKTVYILIIAVTDASMIYTAKLPKLTLFCFTYCNFSL